MPDSQFTRCIASRWSLSTYNDDDHTVGRLRWIYASHVLRRQQIRRMIHNKDLMSGEYGNQFISRVQDL